VGIQTPSLLYMHTHVHYTVSKARLDDTAGGDDARCTRNLRLDLRDVLIGTHKEGSQSKMIRADHVLYDTVSIYRVSHHSIQLTFRTGCQRTMTAPRP
jgi:hypothetical protein